MIVGEDIIYFAKEEYKLLIGERTAERIKIDIGSAYSLKRSKGGAKKKTKNGEKNNPSKKEIPMRGRNLATGLPEEIIVDEEEIRGAIEKSVRMIVQEVKNTIEETPPELLADLMSRGIQMTGGGSLLRNINILIEKETKIPTRIIEDPVTAVVRGAGLVLENLDELREVLVRTEELEPPK